MTNQYADLLRQHARTIDMECAPEDSDLWAAANEIERLATALEFYARAWVDDFSFLGTEPIGKEPSDALIEDGGERARIALEPSPLR